MNNRDPFNLRAGRPPSALTLLQHQATRAANSAATYTRQAVEVGRQALEESVAASAPKAKKEKVDEEEDTMAFQVPRNVPDFNSSRRQVEDASWGGSGRSRFGNGNANGEGFVEALNPYKRPSLPMYKDKPYAHYASNRRVPWFRRKRSLAGALILFIGAIWWLGIIPSSGSRQEKARTGSLWDALSKAEIKVDWDDRRNRVRDAMKLSWAAYEKYAWGYDEFYPISKKGRQMVDGGMGWIIVDALDTLILMNMTTELDHARDWVSNTLTYDKDHDHTNTFETTIRMLGGLLSAHYLSTTFPDMAPLPSANEDLYLEKATDLADRLLGAYDSHSGVPYASVNLHKMKGIASHTDGGASSTAEATSLQLEMKYVAKLTGEANYWEKAEKVMEVVDAQNARDGLVPIFINPQTGSFQGVNIRLGSRGDSYYEYLIKQYLQTSRQEQVYLDMWEQTLAGIKKHLITYSRPSNFTVLAERPAGLDGAISPKMDHLVCFMPGTIALAVTGGLPIDEFKKTSYWGTKQEADMELAKELMKTCWGTYKKNPTCLAPEITHFNIYDPPRMYSDGTISSPPLTDERDAKWHEDFDIHPADTHNLQRPETVESLLYMYRITGDDMYRQWGWEMFQSFAKWSGAPDGAGFTSMQDITVVPPTLRDNMESFWLAETLKYFYLLFSPPTLLPLDQIVLNTEAHPFPRFELGKLFKTGWERKPRDKDGNILPEKPLVEKEKEKEKAPTSGPFAKEGEELSDSKEETLKIQTVKMSDGKPESVVGKAAEKTDALEAAAMEAAITAPVVL